jgi:tetratricopeptide (TPR) repeat protein
MEYRSQLDPHIQNGSPRIWEGFVFFLLLVAFLGAIYGNSFKNSWHYDDRHNIIQNQDVHLKELTFGAIKKSLSLKPDRGYANVRPLAYLSFAFNYYFGELDQFGYHVVNFSIHLLAGLILYLFIRKTLCLPIFKKRYEASAPMISLMAALFWATHPIQVGAVTYIVQRMASMAGMLFLLSMYAYVLARTAANGKKCNWAFIVCVLAGLGALATKENAVMLPICLYFYDLFLIQGINRQNFRRSIKMAFFPILLVLIAILFLADMNWIMELYAVRSFTPGQRLLTEARVVLFYLSLLAYPTSDRLTLIHQIDISTSLIDPWQTLPAMGAVIVLGASPFLLARKWPLGAYCLLFFFLNHAIEGSILPLELIYEHRNYLPSMLIFVLPALALTRGFDYFSSNKIVQGSIGMCVGFLLFAQGHTTHLYNTYYRSELSLWFDNAAKYPNLSVVQNNLGNAWEELGFYKKAHARFQEALRLDNYNNESQKAVVYLNLGLHPSYRLKEYGQGLHYFQKALEISPKYTKALFEAARVSMLSGNLKAAGIYLQKGLETGRESLKFRNALSLVLLKQGQLVRAHREALAVLRQQPGKTQPKAVIGEIFRRRGKLDWADKYWEDVLDNDANHVEANLALLELSHTRQVFHKRNRYALKLLYLAAAEGKTLSEFIACYLEKSALNAYVPDADLSLNIIGKALTELSARQ